MQENKGWVCPRCNRVYAMFIWECGKCNMEIDKLSQPINTNQENIKITNSICPFCDESYTSYHSCRRIDKISEEKQKTEVSNQENAPKLYRLVSTAQGDNKLCFCPVCKGQFSAGVLHLCVGE